MKLSHLAALRLPPAAVVLVLGCCSGSEGAEARPAGAQLSASSAAATTAPALVDAPLAGWQRQLLDLAFRAASALPTDPHIKNRCRAQEAVVAACLRLQQSRLAADCIARIDNWRRGTGLADLALHCAERGAEASARRYLEQAAAVAESPEVVRDQEWRRDRIRSTMARSWRLLGEAERAAPLEQGLVDSEQGRLLAGRAATLPASTLAAELAAIDPVLQHGSLDQVRNAALVCRQWLGRVYDDAGQRAEVEARLTMARTKVPVMVGIELLAEQAGIAVDHKDAPKARELADAAQQAVETGRWAAEDHVRLLAKLAVLRQRAGDGDGGKQLAAAALARFEQDRAAIVDIYRASALRPLAEAWHQLGDPTMARAVYQRAVDEGQVNPNSRPRADDLVATCCSMACTGVEPDAGLQQRLLAIAAALGTPW